MAARLVPLVGILIIGLALYPVLWPVPVDPVAWSAPGSPGYTGPFAPNARLKGLERLPLGPHLGPEAIALDAEGRIHASTRGGTIVRLARDGTRPEAWADTGGAPLGIRFDAAGNLIVADAFRGLLRVAPNGSVSVLAAEADGLPIRYADDLDIAPDGRIYFSDASTKFGAREWGGSTSASLLELVEHRGTGRLLVWDPKTGTATTVLRGLHFANGVALAPDASFVLVAETGAYRVLRHWLAGPRRGRTEPLVQNLPGFPDNVTRGLDGRFWVALISPRSGVLDTLANQPFVRAALLRLPRFLLPGPAEYGHVVAFDADGRIVASLQDPDGGYRQITSALETREHLYLGSLEMEAIGRLRREATGLP